VRTKNAQRSKPYPMMSHRACSLLLLAALGGCKSSSPAIAAANEPNDGSVADDASPAHRDAATSDGSAANDEDSGSQSDAAQTCALVSEMSELDVDAQFGTETGFSIAPGITGFGVVYHAPGCGTLGALPVAASGDFAAPNLFDAEDCAAMEDVALSHVKQGWRAVFVDNSAGSAELQTFNLPEDFKASATPDRIRITQNALHEHSPRLVDVASTSYLAFIAADEDSGQREIDLKAIDDSSAPSVILPAAAGHKPIALAFAQLGTATAALAFVEEEGAPGIWLLPLDKTLQASADPVLLSSTISAENSVDLATRIEGGGAVIYSIVLQGVNHEVRFRRLDDDGGFLGDEIAIVTGPTQGRDASLARLGGGYAVAYRQLVSENSTQAEIRVAFITKEGNVMRDTQGRVISYHIADAAENGGRVTVRVSTDGQLLVGFVDTDDSGKNKLKLVRKRLDCDL
jgi:hypothetical protein